MRQEKKRHEITFKKTVYDIPGMDTVKIRPDVTYDDAGPDPLSMDLYYPCVALLMISRCSDTRAVCFQKRCRVRGRADKVDR